jgi:hypothetical protein
MQQFLNFKTFNQEEEFINFIDLLNSRQIVYQTEIFNTTIDSASLRPLEKEFIVKLRQTDFSQVNQLLDEIAAESVNEVESDHYLFSFSDNELYEIMTKPDEWSAFDYHLAKKILRNRGKSIDDDFLQSLKKTRTEDLSKQEESQASWIILGYAFAVIGAVVGIFIGWYMMNQHKTLPNGQRIALFKEKDRQHGTRIFYTGIVMLVVMVFLRLFSNSLL